MKLDTILLDEVNIGREIERFISFTDRKHWENSLRNFVRNPGITYRYFLSRRNPLIEPLKEYTDLHKSGRSIWKNKTPGIEYLAVKAFAVNKITKNFNEVARKRFLQRLKADDIRALLFELNIAAHFFRKNFDVEFTEYESADDQQRTFDLLVTKGSFQGEIECKFTTFEAGKAITLDGFYLLCDEIYKQLLRTDAHCLIEILCHDKLGKNKPRFVKVAKAIMSAVKTGATNAKIDDGLEVQFHYFSKGMVIKTEQQLESAIKDYVTPKSHFASLGNESKTLIIKIETTLEENVLIKMYGGLKKASKQLSGERPGLIACHVEGIFPNEWEQLKVNSSLKNMVYKFYERDASKHVHTVSFSSVAEPGVLHNFREFQTQALMFCNPNCLFDKGKDIFQLRTVGETEFVW